MVQARTRVMNQLQALALKEGLPDWQAEVTFKERTTAHVR